LWLLPLQDASAFVVLIASVFVRRVHWRGAEYSIRGKELVPVAPRPARG
jgi:hypothetical protein